MSVIDRTSPLKEANQRLERPGCAGRSVAAFGDRRLLVVLLGIVYSGGAVGMGL
jgi:hypothetical protein